MHNSVMDFLRKTKAEFPELFSGGRILECGSMDINGSPRGFFDDPMEYVGIDWRPGPGVDVVSLMHEYKEDANKCFDVVLSTNTFEHDPYWAKSIQGMVGFLRIGGSMIITVAGRNWKPHGSGHAPIKGYYRGLKASSIVSVVSDDARFDMITIRESQNDMESFLLFYKRIA